MRVLIENGTNQLDNLGDLGMLQVTVQRLRTVWPDAQLSVITRNAPLLRQYLPSTTPVVIRYPSWLAQFRPGSTAVSRGLQLAGGRGFRSWIIRHLPGNYRQVLTDAVNESDLVVHAGSGIFADPFFAAAIRHLMPFELAFDRGRPTAFFAQGIGPLKDPSLRKSVVSAFSRANMVTTRDQQSARLLAADPAIAGTEIEVTGDDALALALSHDTELRGKSVGVNVRLAGYSGLSDDSWQLLDPIRAALLRSSGTSNTPFVPLAIHVGDVSATADWLSRGGFGPIEPQHEMTVSGLVRAISACRIVVSASYHGAVFALGQGIPAICLFASPYYQAKFTGLAEAFHDGCMLVDLRQAPNPERISRRIDELLGDAERLRDRLLETSADMVQRSTASYERLPELI